MIFEYDVEINILNTVIFFTYNCASIAAYAPVLGATNKIALNPAVTRSRANDINVSICDTATNIFDTFAISLNFRLCKLQTKGKLQTAR